MADYYVSDGVVSSNLVLDDGWMPITSGGTASKTSVTNKGIVHVSEGGLLLDTVVENCIENGGVSILSGGKAVKTVLKNEGRGYLYEGAQASDTTVSSGASFSIGGKGAAATLVTQDGGTVQVQAGATMTNASLNDGYLYVFSDGTVQDVDLRNRADIWDGALVQDVRVLPGAYLYIRPNGSAMQVQENGGFVDVQPGANVLFTPSVLSGLVLSEGSATLHSGTTAVKLNVSRDGLLSLCDGGIASETTVDSCNVAGGVCITSGGTAVETTVNSGGALYVLAGGSAVGANVFAGAAFHVYEGASAHELRVQPGATLSIQAGANVTDIVENGGNVYIAEGANVTFASQAFSGFMLSSGYATLHSGTTAAFATVCQDGNMNVLKGGMFLSGTVSDCAPAGGLVISDGGIASGATVSSGGVIYLTDGGSVFGGSILNGGTFRVMIGGKASGVTVDGGAITVDANGIFADSIVKSGTVYILEKGFATGGVVSGDGMLQVCTGASASDLTVQTGATLYIQSGATVTGLKERGGTVTIETGANVTFAEQVVSGQVITSGTVGVHSGTVLAGPVVSDEGTLCVSEGGVVSGAAVNSCAYTKGLYIFSGGTALETKVNSGGVFYMYEGGCASGIEIASDGACQIRAGGSADGIRVQSGSYLTIYSGAVVTNVLEAGGKVLVEAGASVTFAEQVVSGQIIKTDDVAIHSGTTMVNPVISDDGALHVSEGAVVSAAVVESCAYTKGLYVFSGGTAKETIVNSGGVVYLYEGGCASGVELTAGGTCQVRGGASANGISVQSGSYLTVYSGATVTNIFEAGGTVSVEAGASVTFADQIISGQIIKNDDVAIPSGTTMVNPVISDMGALHVYEGAAVSSATVNSCAATKGLYVFSGGKASATKVNDGGVVYVYDGGLAAGIELVNGAGCQVRAGGSAKDIVVQSGGALMIYSGAKVTNVLEDGGFVSIEDGADVTFAEHIVSGTVLNDHTAVIHTGTTMQDTTIEGTGKLILNNGGLAVSTTINSCDPDGGLVIYSGGTATSTTANSNGFVYLFSGGSAIDNTITNGGSMTIFSGAVMKNVDIQSGGLLYMSSGSVLTGRIRICSSTLDTEKTYLFIDDEGCTIDFDISEINPSGDEEALLDDFQRIRSEPREANYRPEFTLTVGPDQSLGTYVLGISRKNPDYIPAFTVKTTDNTVLGTLATNQNLTVNGIEYRLSLDVFIDKSSQTGSATLILHVGDDCTGYGPGLPVTAADVTALTSGCVTVTASFDNNTATKQYSYDAANWMEYSAGIVLQENGRVYFRGLNASGIASGIASYTVRNIDTTAPTAPAGLKAAVSGQNVSLSWDAASDNLAGVKAYTVRYSHDGQVFTVTTTDNRLELENLGLAVYDWSVQAVDNVGNISAESAGKAFTVGAAEPEKEFAASGDRDGNGVSDVMFVWTGEHGEGNHAHGYWMNGTSDWWSANAPGVSPDWDNLGSYDMSGDGKADAVMFGNVFTEIGGKGAYIGYYQDGNDASGWVNIGYLNNEEDIAWQNKIGNLTGNASDVNSIVWYAPDLYALGVWTDGTTDWVTLSASFGGDAWTLVGCGDFDGDGKDSVIMNYNNGQFFYAAGIGGAAQSLGSSDWRGWELRAIGDFAGDGKDDLVLFHNDTGSMVLCADGNIDDFKSIGQLAADDWFVVGAGDYNGDKKDDLLVRQYSTGMLGYYVCADQSQWVEMGRGVGMEWTVIA